MVCEPSLIIIRTCKQSNLSFNELSIVLHKVRRMGYRIRTKLTNWSVSCLNCIIIIYKAYLSTRSEIWGTQCESNLLTMACFSPWLNHSCLLSFSTRSEIWDTQYESNSLTMACYSPWLNHSCLLSFSTKSEIWGTQCESNSLAMACYSPWLYHSYLLSFSTRSEVSLCENHTY